MIEIVHRKIVRYVTFKEIWEVFIEQGGMGIDQEAGTWEYSDVHGEVFVEKISTMKRRVMKEGCWGFLQNKDEIHVWIKDREVPLWKIIRLLAHEMGHAERPFHRTAIKEEQKAARYADVARAAYLMAQDLQGMAKKPRRRKQRKS